MTGMNINEFLDKIYCGDELEFTYAGVTYFIQGFYDNGYHITVDFWTDTSGSEPQHDFLFEDVFPTKQERLSAFEQAKLFNGKTIYEAEDDIEVLYG